jgi:hypothetical protein
MLASLVGEWNVPALHYDDRAPLVPDPAPSDRLAVNTMGSATKKMCPTSWIHHRTVIVGGLCVKSGIQTIDMKTQMSGP